MRNAIIASVHNKTGIPESHLESIWQKAIVTAENRKVENKDSYANAVLQKIASGCTMDSARNTDDNGYVIVKNVVITSEAVNQYPGNKVPGWRKLGLDPDKIYNVYRPLAEIIKAKDEFNLMPLLDRHIEIDAESEDVDKIGALGSVGTIQGKDLLFDVIFWHQSDINQLNGVDSNGNPIYEPKKGISAGYRYIPIIENGVHDGIQYDIRMTDIHPNHIAHVKNPRNKPSVVPDSDDETYLNNKGVADMAEKDKDQDKDNNSTMDESESAIMSILEGEGDAKEKVKKILALIKKPAEDEEDDPKDKDKPESKQAQDKKMAKDDVEYKSKDKKNDEYEYIAKDEIDKIVIEHNRNYREAMDICGKHINNNMACDSAEDVYNLAIKNVGANATAFNNLSSKREFMKSINNMAQKVYHRVPMALDSIDDDDLIRKAEESVKNLLKRGN